MAPQIQYKNYVFDMGDIANLPNIYRVVSVLSDSLAYDTFHFKVKSDATGEHKLYTKFLEWVYTSDNKGVVIDNGDFMDFDYGDPVYVLEDGVQKALFYLDDIQPTAIRDEGDEVFSVSCVSPVGILSRVTHRGGLYSGTAAGTILADILGSIPYTVDSDVSATLVYGWLPYVTDARQNLQQVLFAIGASILRNNDGTMRISFNQPSTAKVIPSDRIFLGGSAYGKKQRKSKVVVTEHMYFQASGTAEEVIYDNRTETSTGTTLQVFPEPHYAYRADGLTLISSGANWAEVSGTGRLYAKKYIHSSREVSRVLDANAVDNEIAYTNMTLVSTANINSILDRLANYYTNAEIRSFDAVIADEKPGDLVEFEDRRHVTHTGYVLDIDETASSFWRGRMSVVTDWVPTSPGNDYDSFKIVKGSDLSSGTWTVPSNMRRKRATVVLFSGAQGGQGGYAGKRSPDLNIGAAAIELKATYGGTPAIWELGQRKGASPGSPGGAGGQGGAAAAKMISIDIASLANSYSVSFGAGGAGGAGGVFGGAGPQMGSLGGASVFNGVSTNDGIDFAGTYVNIVTGQILAKPGPSGIAGRRGGDGGLSTPVKTFDIKEDADAYSYAAEGKGSDGGSLYSYTGGAGVNGTKGIYFDNTNKTYNLAQKHLLLCSAGGAGGGGAAMGGNGSAGTAGVPRFYEGPDQWQECYMHYYYVNGYSGDPFGGSAVLDCSVGGAGADATIVPDQTLYTGGQGGHGGGGGGGAGESLGKYTFATQTGVYFGGSVNGPGGNGGQGGQGSDGFAIIYYKA